MERDFKAKRGDPPAPKPQVIPASAVALPLRLMNVVRLKLTLKAAQ